MYIGLCCTFLSAVSTTMLSLATALSPIPASRKALGVPAGPLRGKLKSGEKVSLENGTVVSPDDVLGPSTPGNSTTAPLLNST